MKVVIPMAGRGTRLRPHTLLTPKPLFQIAGKTLVVRLIERLNDSFEEDITEIAFVIGDFGTEVEQQLLYTAQSFGAKGSIYHQELPQGTAHAVYCASESLSGRVVVAFADTLFYSDFNISKESGPVIWTKHVENPEDFGVVKTDQSGVVTDFIEKPQEFVSKKAIIGIYYFNEGEKLNVALKNLIQQKRIVNGEYRLTDALEDMKNQGTKFNTEAVGQWLDCGNSKAVLNTARAIQEHERTFVSPSADLINTQIIHPCYIGDNVQIENSVIGPFVSIEDYVTIDNSIIKKAILGKKTKLENTILSESILGKYVKIYKKSQIYDLGDYSKIL
ncbi:MAG: sugar phosphate nucleotidyltransferase [Bacteroidota bacterium]|nr:sugar phosphate nucleotidyltransferase [Bacteroidota bacterium]